jgi:hypothetical protein
VLVKRKIEPPGKILTKIFSLKKSTSIKEGNGHMAMNGGRIYPLAPKD